MIIGIDPGLSGAIAAVDGGRIVDVIDMPVVEVPYKTKTRKEVSAPLLYDAISRMQIESCNADFAIIEEVTASPQMGSVSAFRFGEAYATAVSVMLCAGIRVIKVRPASWKKKMMLSGQKTTSIASALDMWPDQSYYFSRAKDDGRAEACLLAEYGRLYHVR